MILFRKSYICMYSSSTVWKTAMHYFTSFFCRAALHVKLSVGCSRHYCWASSGLTLCWKESAVAIESRGSVRVFGGSLGGSWRRGLGQVKGHWRFHPSLTLGWQLERRNLLRLQNSWQLRFHRMPWRLGSCDLDSRSLYGPDGGRQERSCCLFCVI